MSFCHFEQISFLQSNERGLDSPSKIQKTDSDKYNLYYKAQDKDKDKETTIMHPNLTQVPPLQKDIIVIK